MDPTRPLVLAGARYASSDDAVQDLRAVWAARHGGAFDHMSVAVLTRQASGELLMECQGSTARDLGWEGVVLGAALLVVAPAAGIAAAAADGGARAGMEGIAGHLQRTIPGEELQEVSQLLESGGSGLLIVAIDRKGLEISPLLRHAEKTAVIEAKTGDLDAAFYGALRKAEAKGGT